MPVPGPVEIMKKILAYLATALLLLLWAFWPDASRVGVYLQGPSAESSTKATLHSNNAVTAKEKRPAVYGYARSGLDRPGQVSVAGKGRPEIAGTVVGKGIRALVPALSGERAYQPNPGPGMSSRPSWTMTSQERRTLESLTNNRDGSAATKNPWADPFSGFSRSQKRCQPVRHGEILNEW
jgi:hypothetical protein